MSPAFTVDCLETLVEIQEEYRDLFTKNGGEKFQLIPAVNDSDLYVDFVLKQVSNK